MKRSSLAMVSNGLLGEGDVFHPVGEHEKTIIFMHGLGDTASGWNDLPKYFQSAPKSDMNLMKSIKFILPTAPTQSVTLNMGMSMPSWFDLFGLEESSPTDHKGLTESSERLERIVSHERVNNPNLKDTDIMVGGFSQGGAVAYYYTWNTTRKLAGLITLSTWFPDPEYAPTANTHLSALKAFHGHGKADEVVHYRWGAATVEIMKRAGVDVTFKGYENMGHSGCATEFQDIVEYVSSVWKAPSGSPEL
eukprot:GHVH01011114.1.p1 GENE.GHVH01011114.1~~GHVH01011114.1.p1  ORF type:complete len:249 (+),score=36.86 GHVH01011114.1:59-805(+)